MMVKQLQKIAPDGESSSPNVSTGTGGTESKSVRYYYRHQNHTTWRSNRAICELDMTIICWQP